MASLTLPEAITTRIMMPTVPSPQGCNSNVVRDLMEGRAIEENFRLLFQRYHPPVLRFFARKGFAPDDCRDLTQEVFVAVHAGLGRLRSEEAFPSWLFSIARHFSFRHLDRLKKLSRETSWDAGTEGDDAERGNVIPFPASTEPDPLDRVLGQERVEMMRQALDELPRRVQECLRARLVDDLNYQEIGQRLGISENTVAVHVHRGLKSLRSRIKLLLGAAPLAGDF
jgi:RNA polymerase sigma-70 factor (ECF subfamily)